MSKTQKKSSHSLNEDRPGKGSHNMRSKGTVRRLNLMRNFKAKRNKQGRIIRAAPFQSTTPSGSMARIEPNRKWFGNTRVIRQSELQKLKDYVREEKPELVLLRSTKTPLTLLQEKRAKPHTYTLLEGHEHVFGKKMRKRKGALRCDSFQDLMEKVEKKQGDYVEEKDTNIVVESPSEKVDATEAIFRAGQSRRIWNELFKVLDSSDVVLYVLDARDPLGTRSAYVENFLKKEAPHKQLIFVVNKCDLVPTDISDKWLKILKKEYLTICFRASVQHSFGRNDLISLLRQSKSNLHRDKQQISVGIIGYPNVGKSSLINCLRGKKVCNVAPIAGETKVWQYVTLFKKIFLIDCPGIVYPQGDTEADLVLKGVVRVEKIQYPDLYIPNVLERVKDVYLNRHYDLAPGWKGADEFLEILARKKGRLLKGAEPDLTATAKIVLNDFQRGRLPYFVSPPETAEKNIE